MSGVGSRGLSGLAVALVLLAALGGCATTTGSSGAAPADAGPATNPVDPWERWNRAVYAFNDRLDRAVVKPVATAYRDFVPSPVRTGVGNFFGNLFDSWSAVNHLLQGKPASGLAMGMRFLTNTILGIGGVLDPASEMAGLERQSEDFGQTLGRWGVGPGPYVVLPLFGPSTLRDAVALPVDLRATPTPLREDVDRVAAAGLRLVDTRAGLLSASRLLEEISLDPYSFLRSAYLARRRNLVYDGDPPELPEPAEPAEPAQTPK